MLQVQKLRRFQFSEWRTRFTEWLQAAHKASRFPDLLRAHDNDSDGCLTRSEFIDTIMSTSALSNPYSNVQYSTLQYLE